jgi:hypothetical protein
MLSPPNNRYYHRQHRPLRWLILLAWFTLLWLAAIHRQDILDWWKLHSYQPPATVSQLAEQDSMTDYGRKVFYVNQPALQNRQDFSQNCPSGSTQEQTIVLGCYRSNQAGIYQPSGNCRLRGAVSG